MKHLPIGISTFSTIIQEGMVYVDKTGAVWDMAKVPGRYILSRPRRFGKSLFVDTLKELFEGNRDLFKGLFIHERWNWGRHFPVIKVDFASGGIRSTALLEIYIRDMLAENCKRLAVPLIDAGNPVGLILRNLIQAVTEKYNEKVVVLVDEYDKPILDNIENIPLAETIKEGLKDFYSVLKEQDANLQFVFLTGVSKFSKVNIFSGINNLDDITLDSNFATICGYTQGDLESEFGGHLEGVDRDELKRWYNGYNFLGEKVYNPFDILLFLQKGKIYRNYWFETGTPTFLIKLLQKERFFLPDFDELEVGEELLSSFEPKNIQPVTLLFQSGYLTIKEMVGKRDRISYKLQFPNQEVKTSFNGALLGGYAALQAEKIRYEDEAWDALEQANLLALEKALRRLFAAIPWRNFTNNDLADFEGYYASVLYAFFSAINCDITPEDITNHGQTDLTVRLGNNYYVMEIKVAPSATSIEGSRNEALAQIRERAYSEKYLGKADTRVFELGLVFGREERNLIRFDYLNV